MEAEKADIEKRRKNEAAARVRRGREEGLLFGIACHCHPPALREKETERDRKEGTERENGAEERSLPHPGSQTSTPLLAIASRQLHDNNKEIKKVTTNDK